MLTFATFFVVCQWGRACVTCFANLIARFAWFEDFTFFIRVFLNEWFVNGPPIYIQFCFKGHVIYKGTDLIATHSLFLLPDFGFRLLNIGGTKQRATVSISWGQWTTNGLKNETRQRRPSVANTFGWKALRLFLRSPCRSMLRTLCLARSSS